MSYEFSPLIALRLLAREASYSNESGLRSEQVYPRPRFPVGRQRKREMRGEKRNENIPVAHRAGRIKILLETDRGQKEM